MPKLPSKRASGQDISAFLKRSKDISTFVHKQPRLLFAIDATASRQPTWDSACQLQSQMFTAAGQHGALAVQLCYYRGFNDFYRSAWLSDSEALGRQMRSVLCEGGHTQIARLLKHALAEHRQKPIRAVVFIGDAVEESPTKLAELAGQCALLRLPLFLFQEGSDPAVKRCFRQLAQVSGGAFAHFDARSAGTLAELLGAVARFATGGQKALADSHSESAKLLLQQLKS